MKNLQVFISKKGTKVVIASDLHKALELPENHFQATMKKWLSNIYEFRDGIRKPKNMKDYSKRKVKGINIDDYYLTVELAKLVALNSRSKVKQKYAKWLLSIEDKLENAELLTVEQVVAVLELSKAMSLVSCQVSAERKHMEVYEKRNGNSPANWWKHRAQTLGYSVKGLKKKMELMGKDIAHKSQRQLLIDYDKAETVRTGIIDLFMALGKNDRYAKNLGKLAKIFAKELNLKIVDDRSAENYTAPNVNMELVNKVRNFDSGLALMAS